MNDNKNDDNNIQNNNNDVNIIYSNTEPLSNNIIQNTTETNNIIPDHQQQQQPKTDEELMNEFLLRENEYKKEIATLQSELKSLTNDELLINLKAQIKTINKQISKYIFQYTKCDISFFKFYT